MNTAIRHGVGAALSMLLAVGGATVGAAQDHAHENAAGEHAPMEGEASAMHGAANAEPGSPATQAYRAANLAMHQAMDLEFSDNADIDFARGMIGHHQGAIDMALIVIEHGQDPDLRQLAEEIIAAQEAEIEFLRNWIAAHAPE